MALRNLLFYVGGNVTWRKKQKLEESKSNMLIWPDDEVQLLLETVKEFKFNPFMTEADTGFYVISVSVMKGLKLYD